MFAGGGLPGALGWVGGGTWEAIHADWPAYPGDRSWELALLRLGDFPLGTDFTCISIIDQCALLVAGVGIREVNPFSDKHIHVALRLEELIELDARELITGVEFDTTLSDEQLHMKRTMGPKQWEKFRSGELVLGYMRGQEFVSFPVPPDDEPWDDEWGDPHHAHTPQRVAIFEGTQLRLLPVADSEVERIARASLEVPPTLKDRIEFLLSCSLFDTAIRDLGAALESRMRLLTQTEEYGARLIDSYVQAILDSNEYLPARVRSLRQELRSIFKFVRNEFAHRLVEVPPSRGYALVSRLCWHVRDVEIVTEALVR